jgi:hypothetical protein
MIARKNHQKTQTKLNIILAHLVVGDVFAVIAIANYLKNR